MKRAHCDGDSDEMTDSDEEKAAAAAAFKIDEIKFNIYINL